MHGENSEFHKDFSDSLFISIFVMRANWCIISSLLLLFVIVSCEKNKNIDTEKPVIDNSFSGDFPKNCDTLYFGESFDFKVVLSDNVELGSFSIGIHNNFDHHSHSTEITECNLDPIKQPINPYLFIQDYDIPIGQTEYETNLTIFVPSGRGNELFDEGDYHFMISLTDKEGWSSQMGLSIKMLH